MYGQGADLCFADCAELAACAHGADGTNQTALAQPTWIHRNATSEVDSSTPIVREVLAEFSCRMDALSGQLAAWADLPRDAEAIDDRHLDYLLEQFRILTFTMNGAMSREMIAAECRIPVGRLQSLLGKFVALAEQLSTEISRADPRDDRGHEIQRQSRSVSQRLVLVIERLCGGKVRDSDASRA